MIDILATGELSVKGNPTKLELCKGDSRVVVLVEDIECLKDIIKEDAKSIEGKLESFINCKSVEELERAGANYFTCENSNTVTLVAVSLIEDGADCLVEEIEIGVTDFENMSRITLTEDELNIICENLPR